MNNRVEIVCMAWKKKSIIIYFFEKQIVYYLGGHIRTYRDGPKVAWAPSSQGTYLLNFLLFSWPLFQNFSPSSSPIRLATLA